MIRSGPRQTRALGVAPGDPGFTHCRRLQRGRLMNTRTARSQYMGPMIWRISSALHEATEIDARNARLANF
jgi:hypothetical protein